MTQSILWAAELEGRSPLEILRWAGDRFGGKLALASSFSAEDNVIVDIAYRAGVKIRVVTLDTGRLPAETYSVMEAVRGQYGIRIETFFPDCGAVEKLVSEKGFFSFRDSVENRKECCRIRKVEPLTRALEGTAAWMTGRRKDQSVTREAVPVIEEDPVFSGRFKINPLAEWTADQVMAYVREKAVPLNALYKTGYRSIGCDPCTRAVKPGEDERSGRWWWENPDTKECGIHK